MSFWRLFVSKMGTSPNSLPALVKTLFEMFPHLGELKSQPVEENVNRSSRFAQGSAFGPPEGSLSASCRGAATERSGVPVKHRRHYSKVS